MKHSSKGGIALPKRSIRRYVRPNELVYDNFGCVVALEPHYLSRRDIVRCEFLVAGLSIPELKRHEDGTIATITVKDEKTEVFCERQLRLEMIEEIEKRFAASRIVRTQTYPYRRHGFEYKIVVDLRLSLRERRRGMQYRWVDGFLRVFDDVVQAHILVGPALRPVLA